MTTAPIDIIGRLQHELNAKQAELEVARDVGLWRVAYWRGLYSAETRKLNREIAHGARRQRFGLLAGVLIAGALFALRTDLLLCGVMLLCGLGTYALPILFPLHAASDESPSSLTSTAGAAVRREPPSLDDAA